MNNKLTIFENEEILILLPNELNIEIKGDFLISAKDVANVLEYTETKGFTKIIKEKYLINLKSSHIKEEIRNCIRKINNAGETFITSFGLNQGLANSTMPNAEEFQDWLYEDVLPSIQSKGSFDIIENQIMKLEDETEAKLRSKIRKLELLLTDDPNDFMLGHAYNKANNELTEYINSRDIKLLKEEHEKLKLEHNELKDSVEKSTVLREGDMDALAVARELGVESKYDRPHPNFADRLAMQIGFYKNPQGNAGYKNDMISIHLEKQHGKVVPTIKYSKDAFTEMKKYIKENELEFGEPKYITKGINKGKFDGVEMLFDNSSDPNIKRLFVNEKTYKKHSKEATS